LLSVAFVLLAVAGLALAQTSTQAGSRTPVFKYYVWGQVRIPGAYSLGSNPDLVELLSAAGGPTQYADVRHVVLVQVAAHRRVKIDLRRVLAAGQVVPLSPGDVVLVPNSAWYVIRDGLSIGTTVVSVATLVLSIMNWLK